MKEFLFSLLLSGVFINAGAQATLSQRTSGNMVFPLSAAGAAGVYVDARETETVKKAEQLFAADVFAVTGKQPAVVHKVSGAGKNIVIVGTVGNSAVIDQLVKEKKIDINKIKNGWEQYTLQVVNRPAKGIDKALVIAGSDRRGAAYGIFSVSEAIGVSPWYWWADVPIKKRTSLHLDVKSFASKTPSVKYRGIFINDEDWGLYPWAAKNFETEVGDIGPKTYAKICELLLRLKANYLSPAMHSITGAFNKYPDNKRVADTFGIVMGSIHAEPLLFNNASEWDNKIHGEWNYVTNKEGINKVLTQRVKENGIFENVYTLALRGIHDAVMIGNLTMPQQVEVLGTALRDQRKILKDVLKQPLEEVPQIFYPYKEVLDIYDAGLDVPDDVTLIWTDDDYGYMRRLSNEKEQKRSGRAGVYYHISYWGPPNDNLWLCTTPPQLMYSELKKAYETTADRLWVVNVGDIKPAEYNIALFMDMAYDIDRFSYDHIIDHYSDFHTAIYGEKYRSDIEEMLTGYYQLAYARKPEYMKNIRSDVFSVPHYNEADKRLKEYERIAAKAEAMMKELPAEQIPSFYQLLYYPIKGSALFNQMWLGAQINNFYAAQQRASATLVKDAVKKYADTLQQITIGYNSLLNAKWKGMMALTNGGGRFGLPPMDSVVLDRKPVLGISAEGQDIQKGENHFHQLPAFNKFLPSTHFIDIFNKGTGALSWRATPSAPWILVNKNNGTTTHQDRIEVSVDWQKVPSGELAGAVEISTGDGQAARVLVSAFNPQKPSAEEVKGLFIETNGYVSIDATGFHRKKETGDIKFRVIEGLGLHGKVVQLGDPMAKAPYYPSLELTSNYVAPVRSNDFPVLEYDFYSFNTGPVDVYTYVVPTFPLSKDYGNRYGVMVDNSPVYLPEANAPYYTTLWIQSILRNTRINKTTHMISRPGKHTVKIYAAHPGVMLQKIVVDFGGLKKSYMGPEFTKGK